MRMATCWGGRSDGAVVTLSEPSVWRGGGQTRTTRGFRVPGSSVLLRRRILEMGPLSEFGRVSRCERGRACRASGPSSARSRPGPVSCCCISEGHIQGQTGLSLRHFKGVRDASSHVRGPVRFSPLSCREASLLVKSPRFGEIAPRFCLFVITGFYAITAMYYYV